MVTTLAQRREKDAPGRGLLRDYLQLAKPRIVVLLIFTTVTAMVVAAGKEPIPIQTLLLTILGGSLAAGGSSALNQYIDRDMDGKMSRTKNRPIPAGRVAPVNALVFGLALIAWSVALLGFFVNWLSAVLALIGALYYVVVYTILLKRNTVLNILIGGGAGAIPVLVGWAAVTGTLAPAAFVLFAIVFYWTPPHSWALALLVNSDYARADVPMMPVARGEEAARVQILLYSIQLVVLSLLPLPFRMLGGFYLVAAIVLGVGMLHESIQLLNRKTGAAARRTYKYSTFYLALLFLSMIIDTLLF
ncbi:MAG: protoheme IX farnesyltransferase [Anaerolineae bacterium]|nr:protoheme IX farnesyltransferase [Anaerolineae bacterium]